MNRYPHIGLLTYAKDFLQAASVIVESGQIQRTRIAATYLYGHAIELALKSILVKNGIPEEQLKNPKKFGHNLEKALKKADSYPEKKFFDQALREIVEMLNLEYGKKHLEYNPAPRVMRLPDEGDMQKTVERLIKKLDARYRKCLRAERSSPGPSSCDKP